MKKLTKKSPRQLKRNLLTLLQRLVQLSEERRPEMRLLRSRPRENLKELRLLRKEKKPRLRRHQQRMMLNQLKKPRKKNLQLKIHQLRMPNRQREATKSQLRKKSQLSEKFTKGKFPF